MEFNCNRVCLPVGLGVAVGMGDSHGNYYAQHCAHLALGGILHGDVEADW